MLKLTTLNPPRFGKCGSCPYYETGTAGLCFACARQGIENLADKRCTVCDLPFLEGESQCRNPICRFDDRQFDCNYAIAMRSGDLERAINRYKFEDRRAWAVIFARVLVGYLDEEVELFRGFDLIVASPTYVSRDGMSRNWDHTRAVIREAYSQSQGKWPFDISDTPAIIKTAATSTKARNAIDERALKDEAGTQQYSGTMQCPSGTNHAIRRVVNGNGVFEKTPKRLWFIPVVYFVGIFESPLSARIQKRGKDTVPPDQDQPIEIATLDRSRWNSDFGTIRP